MKIAFLFTALSVAYTGFAALPPLAQSARELQALVSDQQLQELLGSAEALRDIVKTDSGYVVITQNYFLKVDVEYLRAGHPGPIPFQLHFFDPVRLKGTERGDR